MRDYQIIGAENSPYSIKVRSFFRYKGIPHRWTGRAEAAETFDRLAKLPLVPLVVTPDGEGLQDSTPILEILETQYPEPGIHPDGPMSRFVSQLLEEFGDEWGNKWMFHYRWAREADQVAASERLVAEMMPGLAGEEAAAQAAAVRERMVDRVWFVGSSPTTAAQIEDSFVQTIDLLDRHLASRDFLFGGRPAFADFGLWGQLFNADRDPTPHALIRGHQNLRTWLARMETPRGDGLFEPWERLAPTLEPLLSEQVGALFLPWSAANAAAIEEELPEFSIDLNGQAWTQKPQKYHARSLAALRAKYAVDANPELDELLERTGCREYLS